MANSLEIVRITYDDLVAEKNMEKEIYDSKGSEKKKKKDNKRPSRAIYQPGVSRLSRNKEEQNNEGNETDLGLSKSKQHSSKKLLHNHPPTNQGQTNFKPQQKFSSPDKSHKPSFSERNLITDKLLHTTGSQHTTGSPKSQKGSYYSEDNSITDKPRHPVSVSNQVGSNKSLLSKEDNTGSNVTVFTQVFTPSNIKHQKSGMREHDMGLQSSNSQPEQQILKHDKPQQEQQILKHDKPRPLMEGIPERKPRPLMEGIPERKDIKPFGRGRGRGRNDRTKQFKPLSPKSVQHVKESNQSYSSQTNTRYLDSSDDGLKHSDLSSKIFPSTQDQVMTTEVNQNNDNQTHEHLELDKDRLTITLDVSKKGDQRQVSTQKVKSSNYDTNWEATKNTEPCVNPDFVAQSEVQNHQVIPIPSENWPNQNVVKVLSENWQEPVPFYENSQQETSVRNLPQDSEVKIESENISHLAENYQDSHASIDLPGNQSRRTDDRRNVSGNRNNAQRNKKGRVGKHQNQDSDNFNYFSKDAKLSITVNKNIREVHTVSNVSRSHSNSESESGRKRRDSDQSEGSQRESRNPEHGNRNHREEWKRNHGNRNHREDLKRDHGNRNYRDDFKRDRANKNHGEHWKGDHGNKNHGEDVKWEHGNRDHREDWKRDPGSTNHGEHWKTDNVDRIDIPDEMKPRGGGILKLPIDPGGNVVGTPPKAQLNPRSIQYNNHQSQPRPQRQQDHRGRSKRGDQSRLWDPSRPNEKPAIPSRHQQHEELQFFDPDEEHQYEFQNRTEPNQFEVYPVQYPIGASWADQSDPNYSEPPPEYHRMPPPSPEYIQQTQALQNLHRDSARRLLRDAERYRDDLRKVIDRRLNSEERIAKVFEIRCDLEQQYEGVVLLDLNLCHEKGVEQILWKYAYHQVIEALRTELQGEDVEDVSIFKSYLIKLLDHGTSFYEGLITKLQSSYGFNLQHHTTCLDPLHSEKTRKIKLCLLSAQRCMIALGDLARYKEHANDTSNFGKARSWYLKAQQLAPRNGRPYNQLALLALNTRRKLDAVYYYIRSLEASNPFESARESLNTLFEEVRRKVAFTEQTKLEEYRKKMMLKRQRTRQHNSELNARREVWISHDGHRVEEEQANLEYEDECEDLSKLTPVELNKRFVVSFLNVHGKLFTKIGMETFPMAVEGLLNEFAGLLNHSPPPINSTRLLQLMAINMFSISHTGYKDSKDTYHYGRTPLQEQAIQVGLQMFALLLNTSTQLLKEHLSSSSSNEGNVLNEDLRELLPGVKVWADWMMSHVLLWEQPLLNPNRYSANKDVWEEIAKLLNVIIIINSSPTNFSLKKEEGWQEVVLPEDAAMAGFVPLQTIPLQPFYVPPGQDKIPAMDKVRVNALVTWGNIMEGQEQPLVAYSAASKQYYSCAPSLNHPVLLENENMTEDYLNMEKDVILENEAYEDEEDKEGDGNIRMLRQHKEDLQRKLEQQTRKEREIEAIVESHRTQRQLILEITPIYLVADTNCFIDHLQIIQSILASQRYTLVVPLVVINELDGLSRGGRDDQHLNPGQTTRVQAKSSLAVQFLEDQFENRNRYIRALTAQGSVLQSISFRTEEASPLGNNDDLILNCCVFYCSDKARDYMPKEKDAPMCLRREVVLLTDDRNLRVKALNRNVPVKDIVSFSKWANIGK